MSDSPLLASAAAPPREPSTVHAAIARAAQATGVDFSYLLAQAKLESGLNPGARAATSSAAGLYQFTRSTWLQTLDRHGAEHGLGWAGAAIDGGRVADPSTRSQLLALRYDADASALMAAELAADNRAELTGMLGREPDAAELYLAHFLGSGGAQAFLSTLATDPGRSAASVLPQAAAANRAIFFDGGAPRSVAGVMDLIRGKVEAAMGEGGNVLPAVPASAPGFELPVPSFQGGPIAREFQAAQAQMPTPERRTMAQTLDSSFGGAAPAHVRDAYAKLARFGL